MATQAEIVAGVREHAVACYKLGWDFLVECWNDDEILAEIGGARTVTGAIRKIAPIMAMLNEQRRAAQAEAF